MTANDHTALVRGAYPHLPDALDDELAARLLGRVQPWVDRVRANRRLYDAGQLTVEGPGRGRRAAYEASVGDSAVAMTELEARAAHELYAMLVGMINGLAIQAHRAYQADGGPAASGTPIEDLCQEGYDHFLLALTTYDPDRSRLTTWVHMTVRERYQKTLIASGRRTDARAESMVVVDPETGEESERPVPGDAYQPEVDHETVARDVAGDDEKLQGLIDRLFGGAAGGATERP
jgi:hypothetical protein